MPDAPALTPNEHALHVLKQKREDVLKNPELDSPENKRDGVKADKLARIDAEISAIEKLIKKGAK